MLMRLSSAITFLLSSSLCQIGVLAAPNPAKEQENNIPTSLPPPLNGTGVLYGLATAAYQVEGAALVDGRTKSIWDVFAETPGKTRNGDTGEKSVEQYFRYKEDVALLKQLGAQVYRFSISWNRILPNGTNGPINQKGIDYYNNLINELLANGIQPLVTMFHWDLPQYLNENGRTGWTDSRVSDDFSVYANILFKAFGDRVKYWATFNEPLTFCSLGYGIGIHAPGRCSDRSKCPEGDSSTEPWQCGHNVLLSHGKAVKKFRELKAASIIPGDSKITIVLNGDWAEPYTSSPADIAAANRKIEFNIGWFADPIYLSGDYPASMRAQLGSRLPTFTAEESAMIKGSFDIYGMNHYTSMYVRQDPNPPKASDMDGNIIATFQSADGTPIGPKAESDWLYVYGPGFGNLLEWISKRYSFPEIAVTEFGCSVPRETSMPLEEALKDNFRVHYYNEYLKAMFSAVQEKGVKVKMVTPWSFMDNFEWADGYDVRFGVTYVDYKNNNTRIPKSSAYWLRQTFRGY